MFLHTQHLLDKARDDAYMAAAERVSPNAHEFDELLEQLEESFKAPAHRYEALRQEGYPHHEALLKAGLASPN